MTEVEMPEPKPTILHICKREVLRPIRDAIMRMSGFEVVSTCEREEAVSLFQAQSFALVLIDVEGEEGIPLAETLCSDIKTIDHEQLVAFVCNWRVAILTDCPDHILRTEFDPAAFIAGIKEIVGA